MTRAELDARTVSSRRTLRRAEIMAIYDPITTSYSRGDGKWFVQFYDRKTAQFYAGTGATFWAALAWAMDEYLTRGVLRICRSARNIDERPGELFLRLARASAEPRRR